MYGLNPRIFFYFIGLFKFFHVQFDSRNGDGTINLDTLAELVL